MLRISDISKTFVTGCSHKTIFDQLSLTVAKGDFITIIGSNGAGKSTLLNLIDGNTYSDSGSILLGKNDITHVKAYKRAKKISRVFQDPALGTSPNMTVIENLSMADHKHKAFRLKCGVEKKKIEFYKLKLKDLGLGLEHQLDTKVKLLSGGQRQALALIMATLVKPQLLLLDEHTAALDPKTSQKILELTSEIVEKHRIPTLMVTHNMNDALSYGNRLIMLDQGDIIIDVKESEKTSLTPEVLIEQFKQNRNSISDRLLFN
ncbi:ABC transporter ATP-binding protein [Haloplasma contractile]|uniref:Spermidine-putrescine transport system ATP-binding protein n=1 Tax=Haloplasma contractile SSD-17B TaxID=1033810 RepID=U2FDV6_9MOLU|nr:ATP-binding cassette domain-containing protein [Haloplasma contractile]ERJ11165.1 spermidine-putrescine transport system ATP-binding protein [Haloplasma contractile SSD-17B]